MSRFPRMCLIGLFLSGIALAGAGHNSAAENAVGSDARLTRSHPGFHFSEERQWGTSLHVSYETDLAISHAALNRYAEERVRELCGGDHYRYLQYDRYPEDDAERKDATWRRVEIIVDCML